MKRIVLLICVAAMALLGGSKVSAQGKYGPDSTNCIKYLSYYTEYYKQKNYDSAIPNWRQAYKACPPTSRYSLLSDGTTLLRRLITQNAKNPVYKQQLVDSLMTLYKQRVEFWPKYATASLNNQALDMYNYMKDDPKKLYDGLTEVVSINKDKTKPNIFLFQLNTACDLYKDGLLDPEQVINTYENAVQTLSSVTPKNEVEMRMINKTIEDIESLFIASQVASCDNLIALFEPRLAAAPEDLTLAKNVVRMMTVTEGCTDNQLFLNAVTTMYNLEPSYTSAYYLYKLYAGRNDVENAMKYMMEAITFEESDNEVDAGYFYELAAFLVKNGKNSDAFKAENPEVAELIIDVSPDTDPYDPMVFAAPAFIEARNNWIYYNTGFREFTNWGIAPYKIDEYVWRYAEEGAIDANPGTHTTAPNMSSYSYKRTGYDLKTLITETAAGVIEITWEQFEQIGIDPTQWNLDVELPEKVTFFERGYEVK